MSEEHTSQGVWTLAYVRQKRAQRFSGAGITKPIWVPAENVSPATGVKPAAGDEKGENELNMVGTPKTMSNK